MRFFWVSAILCLQISCWTTRQAFGAAMLEDDGESEARALSDVEKLLEDFDNVVPDSGSSGEDHILKQHFENSYRYIKYKLI